MVVFFWGGVCTTLFNWDYKPNYTGWKIEVMMDI